MQNRGRKAGKPVDFSELESKDLFGRSASDIKIISDMLVNIRKRENLSQTEFSIMLGYGAPTYINRIERGAFPSPEFVKRLRMLSDITDEELDVLRTAVMHRWGLA